MKQWIEKIGSYNSGGAWLTNGMLLISLLVPRMVSADDSLTVYRWEQPDGTVEFSDEARSGADPVVVEEPMVVPSGRLKVKSARPGKTEFSYNHLTITEPAAERTFRNQQADSVEITGKLEPTLRNGHRIFLRVDGAVSGEGSRLAAFSTSRLERGRHTLQLEIHSANDEVLIQSEVVAINVQRTAARPAAGG